ncbi:MAG: hypothetical protein K6F29_05550 [Bacteroidales bacterium]|nr:hypothetical protein [Bacteroidales bacterium]
MMTSAIISALAGILGSAVGACSTHLNHYIDRKSEDRKKINESIHYLLEVFFRVNRINNTEKIADVLLNYYFQRIRLVFLNVDDEIVSNLKKQSSIIINRSLIIIVKHSYEELKSLNERYEDMVANLATILPINAFNIRGKNNLEKLMQVISKYFESINMIDNNTDNVEEIKENISKLQSSIIKTLMNDYKKDLKLELYELLKMTNRYNRYKGKKVIKRLESEMLTEDDKHVVDLFVKEVANLVNTNAT